MDIAGLSYDSLHIDNITINEYFFLVACEIGHKEWLQWACHIDNNLKYNMRDNLPLHVASESNNLDTMCHIIEKSRYINSGDFYNELIQSNYIMAKCVYENFPDVYNSFTTIDLFFIFTEWVHHDITMAKWLYENFPQIPIHKNQHELFINACISNYINVAKMLVSVKPNCYYINVFENQIVHWDIQYRLDIENNVTKDELPITIENCYICYDSANIMTRCRHFYCVSCLEQHYEKNSMNCPYCRKENSENELYNII